MEPALKAYALTAVALFVKMLAISLYQGWHRIGKAKYRNPEDAALVGKAPVSEELPQVQRAARAWANDLENIPAFLILGLVAVLIGAGTSWLPTLFAVFVAARVAHTTSYLLSLQPWRTLAYAVGLVCTLALCAAIVGRVL